MHVVIACNACKNVTIIMYTSLSHTVQINLYLAKCCKVCIVTMAEVSVIYQNRKYKYIELHEFIVSVSCTGLVALYDQGTTPSAVTVLCLLC